MLIDVKNCIIVRPNAKPGAIVGIAQVREGDALGRVKKEGCAVLVLGDGKGIEVRTMLSPDEARELGCMLLVASYQSAGVLMPAFDARAADTQPAPPEKTQ